MKNIVKVIEEIRNTNSRIEKEEILFQNKDNSDLKKIFQFVYDPLITTGLAKKKIEKEVKLPNSWAGNSYGSNIIQMMDYIKDNNTGSDNVIAVVQDSLKCLDEDERMLAISIFTKDLPIGLSSTTLNKVYGKNFIRKYAVMLADKYTGDDKQIDGKFSLSLKLDGLRATVFNYEGGIKIYSRSGKELVGLHEIEKAFEELPKGFVYDGELLATNEERLDSKDLFRKTLKIANKKGPKEGLKFIMFDVLTILDFEQGKSGSEYRRRMEFLYGLQLSNLDIITTVPVYYVGHDVKVINEYLEKVTAAGFEGLMINLMDGKYETKRSKKLLKVKQFHTVDLRILDVVEHQRGGKMGAIVVDYKGFEVKVGSGFSDVERDKYWKAKDEIIGKIIEVQYFEESNNQKDDSLSLRFPTFVRERFEKEEVSYY